MFCPRCGQQAAEEVSFCSRCGLPLDAAQELVESGGELARPVARGGLTPRQRGTRQGLLVIAGGVLFSVIVAILMTIRDEFFPFLIAAGIVLVLGVMRVLTALVLEGHAPAKKSLKHANAGAVPTLAHEAARAAELPPARTVPANAYARPGADTSDMAAAPYSVTEGTTKLLDETQSKD